MALTATVYSFEISLADTDRGMYEELKLTLARHPSESMAWLLTRLIAFCLEYREGIEFTRGLAEAEDPAIHAHDPTGALTLWVDIGTPRAERLHRASKRGAEVAVYVHRDPGSFLTQLAQEHIHRREAVRVRSIPPEFLAALEPLVGKRTSLSLSVAEGQLYLTVGKETLETTLGRHPLGLSP